MEVTSGKVQVPLIAIIGYASFVVVSSLLVGILPALVGLPECKEDAPAAVSADAVYKTWAEERGMDDAYSETLARLQHGHPAKRFAEPELPQELAKAPNKLALREQSRQRSKQLASRAMLDAAFGKSARVPLPKCAEASLADQSTYPWTQPRLPGDLAPVSYDITINVAGFDDATTGYTGRSVISINVVRPVQFFVLSARFDKVEDIDLVSLKDRNNADIPVTCAFINDEYYVFKTANQIAPAQGPVTLELTYTNGWEKFESGIFKVKFNEGLAESALILTKFDPIDAREAFPCFDEPGYKATFKLTLTHPVGSSAASNTVGSQVVNGATVTTTFLPTEKLPTYLVGFAVFKNSDFKPLTRKSATGKDISLWANVEFIDGGYADAPLEMAVKLFDAFETEIFKNVPEGAPPKIDIFASPDYPKDAVPHFGFPIFKENLVLFVNSSQSERNKQDIAFLMAKTLSEFWFGNLVTFGWWDELWLQEALGNYIKYKVFEYAYPLIPIDDQFSVEEMIYVLFEDAYPSSHPVIKPFINSPFAIEAYYDIVETSKATAILRMVEYELSAGGMRTAIDAYLKKNIWGTGTSQDFYDAIGTVRIWPAKDFFDRWFRQSNYPYVKVSLEKQGPQTYVNLEQSRHINSPGSIFGNGTLYPSPYDWTWYIPLNCYFGDTPDDQNPLEREFNFGTKTARLLVNNPNNKPINWVYCNLEFYGYFLAEYTVENWAGLAAALKADNKILEPLDRVAILNDIFANAYTERETYFAVVNVLEYIDKETSYLPWRATYKFIKDLADVMQYKNSFVQISQFVGRKIEGLNITEIWSIDNTDIPIVPDREFRFIDNHISNLWKETIIRLGTELQVKPYLEKASSYWEVAETEILSGAFKDDLPPFIRASVYDFHMQNTYNVRDWDLLFRLYEGTNDFLEERRFLEALTYPRLPWLLAKYLESFEGNLLRQYDFFEVIRKLSRTPLGREVAWDYVRLNKEEIIDQYGIDDLRLGQMILDIAETFENTFLLGELIQYIFTTPSGASEEAYFQALEVVTANVQWLIDNQKDIEEAFGGERAGNHQPAQRFRLAPEHQTMLDEIYKRANRK